MFHGVVSTIVKCVLVLTLLLQYAHSATKVLAEGGDLSDGQAITEALQSTTIEGVGESVVALDQSGDRIESYAMMSYLLGAGDTMQSLAIGVYDHSTRQYQASEIQVVWPGSTTIPPADYVGEPHRIVHGMSLADMSVYDGCRCRRDDRRLRGVQASYHGLACRRSINGSLGAPCLQHPEAWHREGNASALFYLVSRGRGISLCSS